MIVDVKKISSIEEIKKCLLIRKKVFVESQGISEEREIEWDNEECDYFLLTVDGNPAGTVLLRFLNTQAKVERVAVLKEYQGKGLGAIIMKAVIEDIKNSKKADMIVLSAQKVVVNFYQNLGFSITGEEYIDVGIPHQDMQLAI